MVKENNDINEKADNVEQNIDEQDNNEVTEDEQYVQNLSEIEPLQEDEFKYRVVSGLFLTSEDKDWAEEELATLIHEGIIKEGETISPDSPAYNRIYKDYMNAVCEEMKDNAFSLNASNVNASLETMYKLMDMKIASDNQFSVSEIEKTARRRISEIPQLQETFEVVNAGRDIYNMIAANGEIVTTQIEVENKVQLLEDLYNANIMDQEQMAHGYHNIAILMERLSRQKTESLGKNAERIASYDYMSKALRLTGNPQLIKTCFEYLPNSATNKMLFVREACDRALEANIGDESALFKIHNLYSKSILEEQKNLHFNELPKAQYQEAVYHYREALKYAGTPEMKVKVLRSLAKLQNRFSSEQAFETRYELAEKYLEGKIKVRELLKLSLETRNSATKQILLEGAANELIDSNGIKKEEKSLLLSNVVHQLRPMYEKEHPEKLEVLDKIEKKYCQKEPKKTFNISRFSSKGNDYFK